MPDGERPSSIYSLEDDDLPVWINMLIYGYSGIGKTPFWGTGGKRLLLMDSDHGVESAIATNATCDVAPCTGFTELADLYQYVRYSAEAKSLYDWIVWDGITLFMDRVLVDEVLKDAHAQNPKQSEDIASQREYLIVQNRVSDYVRRFVSLPMNFGMSALVMTAENPEGEIIYQPFIPGKRGEFSSKISGYMNIVAYYGLTQGGTRRIITEQTGHYYARDRFNAIRTISTKDGKSKGFLTNPTVPKIEQLVESKKRSNNGKDQAASRKVRRRSGRSSL